MLIKFKKLVILFVCSFPILLISQNSTDIELHNRYWTYRENYRKYFTSIGIKPGQGLPFNKIKTPGGNDFVKVNPSGVDIVPNETIYAPGLLENGGDVTAYMAEYLGVLASEYWLLKHQTNPSEEDIRAVEIELYYALNAIDRLDKYSQRYYDPQNLNTPQLDGFFVRDDEIPSIIDFGITLKKSR